MTEPPPEKPPTRNVLRLNFRNPRDAKGMVWVIIPTGTIVLNTADRMEEYEVTQNYGVQVGEEILWQPLQEWDERPPRPGDDGT